MRKQADALTVCPIPDACLLVMAQRPSRLLGLPETRSLIFLIKNSPDQAEGYLDYLQPLAFAHIHGEAGTPTLAIWSAVVGRNDPVLCVCAEGVNFHAK